MKQHSTARNRSTKRWVGAAAVIAAVAAIALFSMNRTSSSASREAAKPTTAESAMIQAPPHGDAAAAPGEPAATAPAPAGAGGATIFIDPDTRQPRAPTAEEMQALLAAQGRAATTAPEPIVGVNGAPGLRLTDEQMTYTVATKSADGTVSIDHAQGKTDADQKVRAAASAGGVKSAKEQANDR